MPRCRVRAPARTSATEVNAARLLTPTATRQCIGFMIGSSLFAVGSAPALVSWTRSWAGSWAESTAPNVLFFVGAWFFTAAALAQLLLSGGRRADPAAWWAAAVQFLGTVLFNVSTAAALHATTVRARQDLVWSPDAGGSVAFLVSGALVVYAYVRTRGPNARGVCGPNDPAWWSAWINFLGCVAFGVSAVGAIVSTSGATADASVATAGTFVGAVCFFLASAVVLPGVLRQKRLNPA